MGDFLLDMRPLGRRAPAEVSGRLSFFPDMTMHRHETDAFSLALTRTDDVGRWGPYTPPDSRHFIALAGRIALDEDAWLAADRLPGRGGTASKAICHAYRTHGVAALERLNGNFLVVVFDEDAQRLLVVTDRCGMYPCFSHASNPVLGSHPDILAEATNESGSWDRTSLTEFLMCGRVSAPYTYYKRVRHVGPGQILSFDLSGKAPPAAEVRSYHTFRFDPEDDTPVEKLAGELGEAFGRAIRRRSAASLGRSAVALSGGLDSRVILCSMQDKARCVAFCCVDEPNQEHAVAEALAAAAGVEFVTLKRTPDFYGEHAEMGVRISGGMGSIANNHFLGFRDALKQLDIENLLTGCYCDYLLKGLVLDKRSSRVTKRQYLTPYREQHYFIHFDLPQAPALAAVRQRQGRAIPDVLRNDESARGKLEVEKRRTFPLLYEGDNMQRVVPQRVMPWYLPIVDNDILAVYPRLPPAAKLNRQVFSAMVRKQCPPSVRGIPDTNTGAPADAGDMQVVLSRIRRGLSRRLAGGGRSSARDSWPDWRTYARTSPRLREIWRRAPSDAWDVLKDLVGGAVFQTDIEQYTDDKIFFFVRLLTLKIWLDQRLTLQGPSR